MKGATNPVCRQARERRKERKQAAPIKARLLSGVLLAHWNSRHTSPCILLNPTHWECPQHSFWTQWQTKKKHPYTFPTSPIENQSEKPGKLQ